MILCAVQIITQPLLVTVALNATLEVYLDKSETFTITGSTQQLTQVPVFAYGYYIDGQKVKVGGAGARILSIVNGLVTFDADYTGSDFEAVYKY